MFEPGRYKVVSMVTVRTAPSIDARGLGVIEPTGDSIEVLSVVCVHDTIFGEIGKDEYIIMQFGSSAPTVAKIKAETEEAGAETEETDVEDGDEAEEVEVKLSQKIIAALDGAGVALADVANMSERELLDIDGIGPKAVEQIMKLY